MTENTMRSDRAHCPSCGKEGRPVKPITIESLVSDTARERVGRRDGFRFCSEPSCDVAYFQPETGERFFRRDVIVRIGQKEIESPHTVCYCFQHTVEEIEADVQETGTSKVLDSIAAKCRQGLDRCEVTNPQGACCLANVRRAIKEAQQRAGMGTAERTEVAHLPVELAEDCCTMNAHDETRAGSRLNTGAVAQIGAIVSALAASACCWLPLLLIAFGVSGGALAASFEAWRPVLLPVTFLLLGVAFYFAYRKPAIPGSAGADSGAAGNEDCCATNAQRVDACCRPDSAQRMTLRKANRAMLWVVTVLVLAFAFFPNYVGVLLADRPASSPSPAEVDSGGSVIELAIDGMTCAGCATNVQRALASVPGVRRADVSFDDHLARVELPTDSAVGPDELIQAVERAGYHAAVKKAEPSPPADLSPREAVGA